MTLPYFTYNSIQSNNSGLIIISKNAFNGAERDVTFQSIPGRNGELMIDNKRWKNVTIKYECGILAADLTAMRSTIDSIKAWLGATPNYYKLSDTYDPNTFRLAAVKGGFQFADELECYGKSSITFNCKPFKFLTSGETVQTFTASGNIVNLGTLESKPYIKLTGSGNMTLTIGSATYQFRNVNGYIEVDSEAMQCYKGTTNCNAQMYTESFPVIGTGTQTVSFTGATQVEIKPRWCKL